jgi:hypothetical protein
VIQLLIRAKADVNRHDPSPHGNVPVANVTSSGNTPLHLAACRGGNSIKVRLASAPRTSAPRHDASAGRASPKARELLAVRWTPWCARTSDCVSLAVSARRSVRASSCGRRVEPSALTCAAKLPMGPTLPSHGICSKSRHLPAPCCHKHSCAVHAVRGSTFGSLRRPQHQGTNDSKCQMTQDLHACASWVEVLLAAVPPTPRH